MIDKLIRYEDGEATLSETFELFAELVATGNAWTLQGHYGRNAAALIEAGYLTSDGELTERAAYAVADLEGDA